MNFNFKPAAAAAPQPVQQPQTAPSGLTAEQRAYITEHGWTMFQSMAQDTGGSYRKGTPFASAVQFSNNWESCPVTYAAFESILLGQDKVKRGVASYHSGVVKSVSESGEVTLEDGTMIQATKHSKASAPTEGATLKYQTITFSPDTFDVVQGAKGTYFRYFSSEVKWNSYSDKMQTR